MKKNKKNKFEKTIYKVIIKNIYILFLLNINDKCFLLKNLYTRLIYNYS